MGPKILAVIDEFTTFHLENMFGQAGYPFDSISNALGHKYSLSCEKLLEEWGKIPKGYDAIIIFPGYETVLSRLDEPQVPPKKIYRTLFEAAPLSQHEGYENLDLIIEGIKCQDELRIELDEFFKE